MGFLDARDIGQGILAGEHDELGAEFAGELDPRGAGDRHLRGAVDWEVGGEGADQPADPHVLHNGGVHAGRDDGLQVILCLGDFIGEDEGVEGHVAAHAAAVEELHERRQVGRGEILRAHPRVEPLEAEVDRVGAVFDRGPRTFPIAGRRQHLGPGRGAGEWSGSGGGFDGHGVTCAGRDEQCPRSPTGRAARRGGNPRCRGRDSRGNTAGCRS